MAQLPVLVIEDEAGVMEFLRAALERNGYQIVTATTGAEGLALLERGQFLGVISDMRMPGGVSGADVHAWIASHRPELARRVVFITGDTVNDETLAILRQTRAPCVEKPFRLSHLIATVEKTFKQL
jgi:two-component system NtrC family sensor kinase